jgi:hypothetical protein
MSGIHAPLGPSPRCHRVATSITHYPFQPVRKVTKAQAATWNSVCGYYRFPQIWSELINFHGSKSQQHQKAEQLHVIQFSHHHI